MCTHPENARSAGPRRVVGTSRRDIIRYGVAGSLGILAMGPLGKQILRSASAVPLANHRRAVVIYCYGGYDGQQMVVPHGVQAYSDRRPTIAIPAGNTLDFGKTGYGFNPALSNMHSLYQDGDGAVFQKVGYPNDNLSHFTSQDIYSKGIRNSFGPLGIPESGWIARFADAYTGDATGAVSVGVGRPFDLEGGTVVDPLMVGSLSSFEFNGDSDFPSNQQHRIAAIQNVLNSYNGGTLDGEAQQALDQALSLTSQIESAVDTYTPPSGTAYPTSTPGRYLEDIARMIQAGFNTRMFFTGFGGWDNHSNLINAMTNRMDRLDDAIGAFADHCKEMNVWDDMLVLVVSEFGRRNFENGSNGTDHGHGNCFFAFGGGVNQGYYGPDLTQNEIENENWLGYEVDFRDLYREMVSDWFSGDPDLIFPESQPIQQTLNYLA